jgi:hypothetical protein
MYGGGKIITPVTKDNLPEARDNLIELNDERARLREDATDAREHVTDTEVVLSDARKDLRDAESERDYSKSLSRNKYEAAKGAKQGADDYAKRLEHELKKLEPQAASIARQFDLANFQKWMYMEETRRMFDKGKSELYLEQNQRDGEIWRKIYAAMSRLSSAIAGVSPVSAPELALASYYTGATPPHDSSQQTFASAQTSQDSLKASEQNIRELMADPYYVNIAANKVAESDAAAADFKALEAEAASLTSAEQAAQTSWKSALKVARTANKKVTDAESDIQAQQAKIDIHLDNERREALERQKNQKT